MNARTDAAPVNWNALKKFSKVFVTILLSLTLGLAAGEPVLADSDYTNYTTVTGTFSLEGNEFTVYPGQNEYIVPVRLSMTYTPSAASHTYEYLSGRISINGIWNQFTASSSRYDMYFESLDNGDFFATSVGNNMNLYFNNWRGITQGYSFLIGYLHFIFEDVSQEFNFKFARGNSNQTLATAASTTYLRSTVAPYGFWQAVMDGIDSSEAIQDIYQDLSAMKAADAQFYLSVREILYRIDTNTQYIYQWSEDIYNLLYDYIYPSQDPAAQASSAANVAESLAAAQVAQEQALMSMAPGNMEELDAAAPLGILDDVSNSTRFWGTLVQEFSTGAGALWGVFIFALLVGLITFILRLR